MALPAMDCVPLKSADAGGQLAYDRTLRTQRRKESTLLFVAWRGELVFDAANPSVFARYAGAAPAAASGPAAARVDTASGVQGVTESDGCRDGLPAHAVSAQAVPDALELGSPGGLEVGVPPFKPRRLSARGVVALAGRERTGCDGRGAPHQVACLGALGALPLSGCPEAPHEGLVPLVRAFLSSRAALSCSDGSPGRRGCGELRGLRRPARCCAAFSCPDGSFGQRGRGASGRRGRTRRRSTRAGRPSA